MLIQISQIVIPENRFRREFDQRKMEELRDSILRIGLLQPVVVEKTGDTYTLRAGERRFKAISEINSAEGTYRAAGSSVPPGHIPVLLYDELNELQRLEVEIEENVVRADFTWQERDRALAKLHEFRKLHDPTHTLRDTATEVIGKPAAGSQIGAISNAVLIAKHLDDPDVAKAKTQRDALKVIAKKAQREHHARLATKFDLEKSPHVLALGDALGELGKIPEGTFDVIVTDPPYGIAADNFGEQSGAGHEYEDNKTNLKEIMSWLPAALTRVSKEKASLYMFCDLRFFQDWQALFVLENWRVFPLPLIWAKSTGMLPLPKHGPRRTYECILYAYRGDRETLLVKNDVISVPNVKRPLHGAQKPAALYYDLLSRSANPGDRVLDCFGGTGPILVAANRLRCVATYIERDENFYNIALGRVNQAEIDDGAYEDAGLGDIEFDAGN